eukprot:363920-Chlamydomonas_euryale.AAC.9
MGTPQKRTVKASSNAALAALNFSSSCHVQKLCRHMDYFIPAAAQARPRVKILRHSCNEQHGNNTSASA